MPPVDLAIPAFGGQNHVSIDGEHGPSRKRLATAAPACEGIRPREGPLDRASTSQSVCGDTARRPAANESSMNRRGCISRAHRKKPKGRSMPETMRRANGMKSQAASKVEHMFAEQKSRMGLVIRTMGIAPARTMIGLANPAYGMKHLTHLDRTAAT